MASEQQPPQKKPVSSALGRVWANCSYEVVRLVEMSELDNSVN
jgi:hypothetical protein